jgi:hypothetical protein
MSVSVCMPAWCVCVLNCSCSEHSLAGQGTAVLLIRARHSTIGRSLTHACTHTHAVGFHNPDQVSPHMDALVKEGVQLEGHYTFQFCSPTRSAFLSGR